MIPIQRRNSASNDCSGSGDCDETHKWFDTNTLLFQVPIVGGSTELNVCDPSRYSVGQWIYILGAGRFYITALNTTNKTITIRNACIDGTTAIVGNATPGTAFQVGTALWIIDEPSYPDCTPAGFCEDVLECVTDGVDICLTNIPNVNETDEYHLFGGSGASCDGEELEVVQSCLRKILNVFYKAGALCFSARSTVGGSSVDVSGTDTPKSFIVNDPSCGCDTPIDLPSLTPTGMYKYCDGDIVFVEDARFFLYRNELLYENAAYALNIGSSAFNITLADWPGLCGTQNPIALFHIQVYASTGNSNDLFEFDFTIGGETALKVAGNEQFNANNVTFPGTNDNTIPVEVSSGTVSVGVVQLNGTISGTAKIKIWLRGYYV